MATKEKTLSYRRALWFNNNPASIDLGSCIGQATKQLKHIDERSVTRDNGQLVKLLWLDDEEEPIKKLHISVETPGEAASIVPSADDVDVVSVGTTEPPPDSEFMDGDAFLLVRGDDVCVCSTLVRDGAIIFFLKELFKNAGIRKDAAEFDLVKVADIDKVKLMHAQGVKEIVIKSTLYDATAQYAKRKAQAAGILGGMGKHLKAFLGNEHDANKDALQVILTVKTDARREGLKLGEKRIEAIAEDLLENQANDDDFVIITKEGQRIGPNEIYMKSKADVKAHGKSVERIAAWNELLKFFNSLENIGATEQ